MLAEVVSLELRLLDPAVRVDTAEVERLLHADFREIGAFGETWDRTTITGALAATPGDRVAVSDLTARFVRDDVVLVTYAARRGTRASLRSSLWVQAGDGWQVLFHQGTPVDRDV